MSTKAGLPLPLGLFFSILSYTRPPDSSFPRPVLQVHILLHSLTHLHAFEDIFYPASISLLVWILDILSFVTLSSSHGTIMAWYTTRSGPPPEAAKQTAPTKIPTSKLPDWPPVSNGSAMPKTAAARLVHPIPDCCL